MAKAESSQRAFPPAVSYFWLWLTALAVLILDQLTKYWTAQVSGLPLGAYPPDGGIVIIPGYFSWVYAINYGAAWGMFAGMQWALVALAVVALIAIGYFRAALELNRLPLQFAFGMIVGGIVGNAIDRSVHGYVIDFLDVHLQFYHWPTFNIADSGIVLGTGIYLLCTFRADTRARQPRSSILARPGY